MKFLRMKGNYLGFAGKGLLFVSALAAILYVMPREGRFKYDYVKGKPWRYESLIAPFDFSILKPKAEYEAQKFRMLANRRLFFDFDEAIAPEKRKVISQAVMDFLKLNPSDTILQSGSSHAYRHAMLIADSLYRRGIIQSVPDLSGTDANTLIMVVRNKVARESGLQQYFTIRSAYAYIQTATAGLPENVRQSVRLALEMGLHYNLGYNQTLTHKATEQLLDGLSAVKGLVQEGEKVISQGELIDEEKFQVLESFKSASEARSGTGQMRTAILLGQVLLISLALLVLGLFMYFFRPAIFADNRQLGLILLVIVFMVSGTALVVLTKPWLLYAVPVCLVPILMRVFFDTRVALYIHIITIILIGFLVPNSFEFVFLQLITGLITIFSVANFQRRQQFVITAVYVFLAYGLVYTGLYLIQEGRFAGMKFFNFALFGGGASLLLLAYPAIWVLEKAFGMVTDITLLELSDTNGKPLRELASRAPGTFQHSLQVANLAEEVIREIGGNPLLVRAGALYHDIGKMDMPMYFVENQYTGFNPHDELSPSESAEIILSHVKTGLEKARKLKLPGKVADFIRTHHGTRKVEYFYQLNRKQNPEDSASEDAYTYKGPLPYSKETSVLMMADSIEAATRSISKPDEERISALVDGIINSLANSGQFSNADITYRDIGRAGKIIKRRLLHMYHIRVAYDI
jgi:hypothetical protein